MALDAELAREALARNVGEPLGISVEESAAAVFQLATEHMADAIEQITLVQGVDPAATVIVGGGGGGGLYSSAIGRRLGSPLVVIPEVAAALSATGTILSDLQQDFLATELCVTDRFDVERANAVLERLLAEVEAFDAALGNGIGETEAALSVEARYANQIWEIEVPLAFTSFSGPADVDRLCEEFHRTHEELFAFRDPDSPIEVVAWRARARLVLGAIDLVSAADAGDPGPVGSRPVFFPGLGAHTATVHRLESIADSTVVAGRHWSSRP